jgi:hypothetical protein
MTYHSSNQPESTRPYAREPVVLANVKRVFGTICITHGGRWVRNTEVADEFRSRRLRKLQEKIREPMNPKKVPRSISLTSLPAMWRRK